MAVCAASQLTDTVGRRAVRINCLRLGLGFQCFVCRGSGGDSSVVNTHHGFIVSLCAVLTLHHHQGFGLLGLGGHHALVVQLDQDLCLRLLALGFHSK